jgi:DNA-binding response OmpR family regulator/putative methionine-R-sulfoxide reductase with GAF domain
MTLGDIAGERHPGPILVVDDEESVRTMFVRTLEEAGYRTVEAVDGPSALAAAAGERPSLVLLDITIPRLDGVEVVKAIRAGESGFTIPIILVTALAQVDDRVRGLDAGADDYLAKPVALDELVARVAAHLRTRRALANAIDSGARKAERERARFVQLTATVSTLDARLHEAVDERSVFQETTTLLASAGGVVAASIALAEPTGLMRVHAAHGDGRRLKTGVDDVEDLVQQVRVPIAWALETGDVFVHTLDEPNSPTGEFASEAVIPIRAGAFAIGVLTVEAAEPDFFGQAEIRLLERAAGMVAARLGEIERLERERALTDALEAERFENERFAALTARVDATIARVFRADGLFRVACQLPVDLGLCALAWFGLVQSDSGGPRLHLVASAYKGEGHGSAIKQIGRMPTAFVGESAIATDRVAVVNDTLDDPRFRRCHHALRAAGLRSMAFVPIFTGLRPAAGIAFYSAEVGAFGVREVAVLERLGADVAHRLAALDSVRRLPRSREGIRMLAKHAKGERPDGSRPTDGQ